eukprot:g15811.t1
MNEDIQLPTYKDLEKAFTALWTYKFVHLRQTAPGRGAPAIVPVPDDEDAILQEATNKMSVNKYQLVTPADLAWQYRGDVDAPNVIRRWYDVLRFAMETLVRGERVRGADLLRPERMLERTYVTESTPAMDLTRQQLQMLSDDPRRPENEERLRDVQQSTHDSHAFVDATAKVDPDSAQAQELRADRGWLVDYDGAHLVPEWQEKAKAKKWKRKERPTHLIVWDSGERNFVRYTEKGWATTESGAKVRL